MKIFEYDEVIEWAKGAEGKSGPHLLLGNGFSMAFNPEQFSYKALKDRADQENEIGVISKRLFDARNTNDFEGVIRELDATVTVLESMDGSEHEELIEQLKREAEDLKDSLARAIADLHPDIHYDIDDEAFRRVGEFLRPYVNIYTTNYDVLLYWVLMKNMEIDATDEDRCDDGFREARPNDDYVVWDNLRSAWKQNIFYLHGALHLFLNEERGELQKVTWSRTSEVLLTQIRQRLSDRSFPLVITEGTSEAKRSKILQSDYLGRNLRSLANVGGGVVVYGLGFSDNDNHLKDAIFKSKATRLAVSLYGDPVSESNLELRSSMSALIMRRQAQAEGNRNVKPLELRYYSADSAELW